MSIFKTLSSSRRLKLKLAKCFSLLVHCHFTYHPKRFRGLTDAYGSRHCGLHGTLGYIMHLRQQHDCNLKQGVRQIRHTTTHLPDQETMRMLPVVPIIMRKAKKDVIINGLRIAEGTLLAVHVMAMHNSSRNWESADCFLPVHHPP